VVPDVIAAGVAHCDYRRRPVDGEDRGSCRRLVVLGVARSKGRDQRLRSGVQDSACGRGVHEGSRRVCRGIELLCGKRRAIRDGSRSGPRNRRSRLAACRTYGDTPAA
jgi:hypothetical protein